MLIQRFRQDILAEWKRSARSIAPAKALGGAALVDHIPELIDEIAEVADAVLTSGGGRARFETARRHALDRLEDGFDVCEVVDELSLLRESIFAVWERENGHAPVTEVRALDLAIDQAIHATVSRFAETHRRTLTAIDRISTATLEATDRDELLQRLLAVFKESTPAVDTVAILLREGGELRNCATVGLEEEVRAGFFLRIGEGFAGTIAARREPMELRDAYAGPLVKSEVIRKLGIRALYGVPLIHEGDVIGVAHMGSRTANEFTSEDRQLFASLAARATVAIVTYMLRHELAASEQRYKRLAHERERALSKLESLLAGSPVGIAFLDRDLRYLRINDTWATLIGHAAADRIGKTGAEMMPNAAPMLRNVIASGEPILNIELDTTLPATGDRVSLLANFFPVRTTSGVISGVGVIIVDVTDRKRAQEALRLEQARLQEIIDHAPAAIWVKDQEGRIVIANRPLADALGTPYETIIGKRSTDILPGPLAGDHEHHDDQVLTENRAVQVEEVAPAADGPRTFLSIKFPLPGPPRLIGGIATDITERKKLEQDLRVAVEVREELVSVVSHDLRTPLATVQLSAAVLAGQHGADVRSRRHVEMIVRACGRMETLINDLLDVASIRAGRFKLEMEREVIDDVVAEAIELHQALAAGKDIEIKRAGDVHGIEVRCDRSRILQVFANLIGNSIKFCRSHDVIKIVGERDGDYVRISVEDTGPGISPAALSKLFEPYWSSPEHVRKGTGLGLYIVRGIIESHGGRVWVESDPGRGARFTFTLPIADPH